jgi:alkaline phosphatase D
MKIFTIIIASALIAVTTAQVVHAKQQEAAANGYPLVKAATAANGDARSGRLLKAKGEKGYGGDSKTAKRGKAESAKFSYGVASGDPLANAVIIWTAIKGARVSVPLAWHVARDVNFQSIVKSGHVTATSANGYTAKVDVTGLSPESVYYYRFKMGSSYYSPVGKTRTLSVGDVNEVKLAVFSCANYPGGYFHAYKEAATRGAQFAVFLGDYIYEYEADGYASSQA